MKIMSEKVITGKVRLSYVQVWTPKAGQDGGEPKYSCAILVPKSDKATVAKIKEALDKVKADPESVKKWGKKFNSEMKGCIRDGDLKADEHPEYAGHYFFNASSKQQPGIVGRDRQPILDHEEIYSGVYAMVSVNFYAFNQKSQGIGAGLNNIMKVADGERLGGSRASAEDDFADVDVPEGDNAGGLLD